MRSAGRAARGAAKMCYTSASRPGATTCDAKRGTFSALATRGSQIGYNRCLQVYAYDEMGSPKGTVGRPAPTPGDRPHQAKGDRPPTAFDGKMRTERWKRIGKEDGGKENEERRPRPFSIFISTIFLSTFRIWRGASDLVESWRAAVGRRLQQRTACSHFSVHRSFCRRLCETDTQRPRPDLILSAS
jgi:hypothetical protein